jgi:hypothetical protein
MQTPVLLIIFNRPEITQRVFGAIRKSKPRKLFVAADGPRPGKAGEAEKSAAARKIVTEVDWDCEVKTLFRDENLGCGRGPSEAISWFFENVESGIILEDDCFPSPSFFPYCDELLLRYRESPSVMLISGLNLFDYTRCSASYLFSNYAGTWGWATWKRAWNHFNYDISEWSNVNSRNKVIESFKQTDQRKYYEKKFEETFLGQNISWWDYQWLFARILHDGVGIIPTKNLIENIGFGEDATHTFDINSFQAKLEAKQLDFPLIHPDSIKVDETYDANWVKTIWKRKSPLLQMLKRIWRI